MRTLLLTLRFLGTNYHGWQVQENAKSVMEEVQDAVEALLGQRDPVTGCSRTDTGVHAEMFCCTLRTENPISCYRLIAGMNAKLPEDIAVSDCVEVPEDFHPRYDATAKQYRYRIWNGKARNPFWEGRAHYVHPTLDVDRMNGNAKDFLGTHDFTSFTNSKEVINDNVRTVRRAEVFREGEPRRSGRVPLQYGPHHGRHAAGDGDRAEGTGEHPRHPRGPGSQCGREDSTRLRALPAPGIL